MLWYLHLCADAGVTVLAYRDEAVGTMVEDARKGGYFTKVTLHPKVTIAKGGDAAKARDLHKPRTREVLHRQLGQLPRRLRARDHRGRIASSE